MRLFNGHLKMDAASLKKVFLMQLANIYSIKTYLVVNLPLIAASASFKDLKFAIEENIDVIKAQLLRIDVIYQLIEENYHPQQCLGIRALTIEAFRVSLSPGMTKLETELSLLYHLRTLESIEISCFSGLTDLALALPNGEMTLLLRQNLDLAKDSKALYDMIMDEYVN